MRVVCSDTVIDTAGQQQLHQTDVIPVNFSFFFEGDVGRLVICAFAKANTASIRQQIANVGLTAIQVGLDDGSHSWATGANAFHQLYGALRVDRALHVHA